VEALAARVTALAKAQPALIKYLRFSFAGSRPVAAECLSRVTAVLEVELSSLTGEDVAKASAARLAPFVLGPALLSASERPG